MFDSLRITPKSDLAKHVVLTCDAGLAQRICRVTLPIGLKASFVMSYAAGSSAMNYMVERLWSQYKSADIGQRYGQAFLGGTLAAAI